MANSNIVNSITRQLETVTINSGETEVAPGCAFFNQGLPAVVNDVDSTLDIETMIDNRSVAPIVSRIIGYDKDREVVIPDNSSTADYIYGYTAIEGKIDKTYGDKRAPGESIYPDLKQADLKKIRMSFGVNNVKVKNNNSTVRRLNQSGYEVMLTARQTIADEHEGVKYLDWGRDASLKERTVEAIWSTPADAKPWNDLGSAIKDVRKKGFYSGKTDAFCLMGETTLNELMDIYRSQRAQEVEPILFYSYKFTEEAAPKGLAFMVNNGLEYRGWVETSVNTKVHLFGSNELVEDDSGDTVEVVPLTTCFVCLYNPLDYRSYFGPSTTMESPNDAWYETYFATQFRGAPMSLPNIDNSTAIGNTGLPVNAIKDTVSPLENRTGINLLTECTYIFVLRNPNSGATIDITTAS